MTGTIDRTPCPECNMVNNLFISIEFVAKPLGTWSLSGNQMKTVGAMKPVLKCKNCDFILVGEFDGDSHVVFPRPEVPHGSPDTQDASAS